MSEPLHAPQWATLQQAVVAISRIPYGRPCDRSPAGVLRERRGTCSTKHLLLAAVVEERWPECQPRLWHRVYRVTSDVARAIGGEVAVASLPKDGLVDVHTYATLLIDGADVRVDVTIGLNGWDGRSDIPLACGPGDDHAAGPDPFATKAALVARFCDETARESFIRALAGGAP